MKRLVRFGVSIEEGLLENFDEVISKKGYANRSEAIRDLIRDYLVEDEWGMEKGDNGGAGLVGVIFTFAVACGIGYILKHRNGL